MATMLTASLWFDAVSESSTGNGWILLLSDDTLVTTVISEDPHETLLDALNAIQDAFSADTTVDSIMRDRAEQDLVAVNQGAVDAAHEALRIAEGLDP